MRKILNKKLGLPAILALVLLSTTMVSAAIIYSQQIGMNVGVETVLGLAVEWESVPGVPATFMDWLAVEEGDPPVAMGLFEMGEVRAYGDRLYLKPTGNAEIRIWYVYTVDLSADAGAHDWSLEVNGWLPGLAQARTIPRGGGMYLTLSMTEADADPLAAYDCMLSFYLEDS